MHQQLHEPDSTRQIETIVDGEPVRGTVHLTGSSRIKVKLDWPSTDLLAGKGMSFFSRVPDGEPGYLGKYGETLAMKFLLSLYEQYKKGDRRRQFAGTGCQEFGRVRYLTTNPGYPARGVKILEKTPLDVSVHVQLESDGPYRRARFFDSGTDQPFLAESAVWEEGIQVYIDGVKADLGFSRHLETVRLKQLPRMVGNSAVLKTYQINPYQADFLNDFGKSRRTDYMPLTATEIDELIQLGYLIRDRVWASTERVDLDASLARTRKAMENFEARGKEHQAAECRAKVRKLELRIDLKTLSITPAGEAAVKELPYQVELISHVF